MAVIDIPPADWYTVQEDSDPFGVEQYFPPISQRSRIQRCRLRWSMEQGEFSKLVDGDSLPVKINLFKALSDRVVDIICQAPTGDMDRDKTAAEAVRAYLRDSTPLIWWNPETEMLEVLDSRFWYPIGQANKVTGWVSVLPLGGGTFPDDGGKLGTGNHSTPDKAIVRQQHNNQFTETLHEWNHGSVGKELDRRQTWEMADTLVVPEVFDQSIFDIIAPAVIEISRRYSSTSRALDRVDGPNYGVIRELGPEIGVPNAGDGGAMQAEEVDAQDDLIARLNQKADDGVPFIEPPPGATKLEVLTFQAQTDLGSDNIAMLRDEIETLTGLPNVFGDDGGFTMATSGVALRQLNIPLYARMRKIQTLIHDAMNASLQRAGQPTFDWVDAFTYMDGNTDNNMLTDGIDETDDGMG